MKSKTPLLYILAGFLAVNIADAQKTSHSFSKQKAGWHFSVGARVVSKGASVEFENLGTVPERSSGLYDNGFVNADELRSDEPDPPSGERYQTFDDDGVQIGDFLSFNENQTRSWGYNDADQVEGNKIKMNSYSSVTTGAATEADSSLAGGFEVQLSKVFFQVNRRVQVSMMGSLGLTDISVRSSGRIAATLNTRTDTYGLLGTEVPSAPYFAPSFEDIENDEGNIITRETTIPLSQSPEEPEESETLPGAAVVDGDWEVDGAYVSFRLGPMVHVQLTDIFQVSMSAGVSAHFAGTQFKYREQLVELDTTVSRDVVSSNEDVTTETMFGYFVEANIESWLNEKAGFFLGVHYEAVGDYEQELDGRVARIDLGGSAGIRGGMIFRF